MQTFTTSRRLPKQVPAFPRDKGVLRDVFARVRSDFPNVAGLTSVTADTAIFQITGDPIRYCLRISAEEARSLGYVAL